MLLNLYMSALREGNLSPSDEVKLSGKISQAEAALGESSEKFRILEAVKNTQIQALGNGESIMTSAQVKRYLAYLPMDWYEKEVSSFTRLDHKVVGLLLVRRMVSGMLQVKLLFASGPDSQKNLLRMIIYSIRRAGELYPPDTKVMIRCESEAASALAGNLFPQVKGRHAVWGSRTEEGTPSR
ncbi:MAG: hypothetical protein K6F35_06140 [Lachnospiraceae bacterium]|nr:hypothetical protein [Lachnospiraceae bacterium]